MATPTTANDPLTASVTVALIGNPNVGKSTLFNALAGVRQRVGNYPGVTVDKKIGRMTLEGRNFSLVDLPGTYSLAPRSPDEMVAVDVLLGRRNDVPAPDAVICIIDASNLERNLYLVSQVFELGLPTVVAVNMVDVARQRGLETNLETLEARLGVPVVAMQANRRQGIKQLGEALTRVIASQPRSAESPLPEAFCNEVKQLESTLLNVQNNGAAVPRYLVERLLVDSGGYIETALLRKMPDVKARETLLRDVESARERLREAGHPVPAVEPISRYRWIAGILDGVVRRPAQAPVTLSDRIDRVLIHRFWGLAFFVFLMLVVFQSVFAWATYPMDWIDAATGVIGESVEGLMAEGPLRSLIVEGVIAGVGGVLIFLPQIFVLFFFLAVLEDCGYMARAAYLMDRLLVPVGLSGKSFVPLLSSFACAIPGIMATRIIEDRRDRLTTILIAPLMSCSARLPVYTVLIAAFIPAEYLFGTWLGLQGLTMAAMYAVGIVAAIFVALVLKRTILRGPTPPLVMELPAYKWPSPSNVLHRMFERGWAFVRRAGTLIVAVSIIVWASLYYPHNSEKVEAPFVAERQALETELAALEEDLPARESLEEQLAELQNRVDSAYVRQSVLGRLGQWVEPVVKPLGWDWRIGCAAIASFPAREVVIATLGIIYELGGEVDLDDEQSQTRLTSALRNATWDGTDRKVFNVPVALSLMVFFALCAQCAATLVVMRRETQSWRWPVFTFVYMTSLAYVAALVTYQVGIRLIS